MPARIVELLARPQLTALPENPVGKVLELVRGAYADFADLELPEIVDWAQAQRSIGREALYVDQGELQRIDEGRILRYDLTLPLLMHVRFEGTPLRLFASGKAYRVCQPDPTHLEAFHQAEVFCLDDRTRLDMWQIMGRVLRSADVTLRGLPVRISPTTYPMCSQAWTSTWNTRGAGGVLACGVFTDTVVAHLGADSARHTAIGVGYGLERLAMLRYGSTTFASSTSRTSLESSRDSHDGGECYGSPPSRRVSHPAPRASAARQQMHGCRTARCPRSSIRAAGRAGCARRGSRATPDRAARAARGRRR